MQISFPNIQDTVVLAVRTELLLLGFVKAYTLIFIFFFLSLADNAQALTCFVDTEDVRLSARVTFLLTAPAGTDCSCVSSV